MDLAQTDQRARGRNHQVGRDLLTGRHWVVVEAAVVVAAWLEPCQDEESRTPFCTLGMRPFFQPWPWERESLFHSFRIERETGPVGQYWGHWFQARLVVVGRAIAVPRHHLERWQPVCTSGRKLACPPIRRQLSIVGRNRDMGIQLASFTIFVEGWNRDGEAKGVIGSGHHPL